MGVGGVSGGGLRVAAIGVYAFVAGEIAGVPSVSAAGGPSLVAFFAVVFGPGAHPVDETG